MIARHPSRRFCPMIEGLDLRIAPTTFLAMPSTSGMTITLPSMPDAHPAPAQPATSLTMTLPDTTC